MKKCPNCGTKNADSSKQCNFCHENLLDEQPITTPKKEADYIHNEAAEKKKAKTRKTIIAISSILVVAALVGILAVVFSGDKTTKSQELVSMMDSVLKTENTFSGTIKGDDVDISFVATVKPDNIIISLNGYKNDFIYLSKEGMILKTDRVEDRRETTVTKDMEEYNLYIAYLLLTSSEKSPLELKTKDIETSILPIVKDKMIDNFDNTFIKDNFVSGISSALMTLENEVYLKDYLGITLPDDVKNAEIPFDIASYNLQNHVLSQFKKSFKNQTEYETINQLLKDSKSNVKDDYKAKGTIITENGKLKSASAKITYGGESYQLNISFS